MRLRLGLIILICLAQPSAGRAAWLRCSATGTMETGVHEFVTTIAEVGPLPPAKLGQFEKQLTTYVRRVEPTIQTLHAKCTASDDQIEASAAADHFLDNEARRLGWEHLTVVAPMDWLPASESGRDIYHP